MATQINNTASATYGYGKTTTDYATSNVASTNLIEEYAISAYAQTLNTSYRPGENITLMVTVRNDGTSPLYNVKIEDDLGGALNPMAFVEGSASLNINGTNSTIVPTSTDPLTFTIPQALAGGGLATVTFIAKVSPMLGTSTPFITNTATITANEGSAGGSLITVTPNPTNIIPLADFANVTINKSVSSNQILPNEQYSYTIKLENSGNLSAENVILTDILPTGFAISSITALTNGQLTTYSASDYTLDGGSNTLTLPSGSGAAISVPAAVSGISGVTTITITGSINS